MRADVSTAGAHLCDPLSGCHSREDPRRGHGGLRAVYLAIGIDEDGYKDVLGMWIGENEGANFWLWALNDLKARGLQDVLIAVVDGLKGFPEALETAFPKTTVQTCIDGMFLVF